MPSRATVNGAASLLDDVEAFWWTEDGVDDGERLHCGVPGHQEQLEQAVSDPFGSRCPPMGQAHPETGCWKDARHAMCEPFGHEQTDRN